MLNAFRRGIMGHLMKNETEPDKIVAAIRAVYRGDVVLSPKIAGSILDVIVRGEWLSNGG